jgi:hypothetical protein
MILSIGNFPCWLDHVQPLVGQLPPWSPPLSGCWMAGMWGLDMSMSHTSGRRQKTFKLLDLLTIVTATIKYKVPISLWSLWLQDHTVGASHRSPSAARGGRHHSPSRSARWPQTKPGAGQIVTVEMGKTDSDSFTSTLGMCPALQARCDLVENCPAAGGGN